MDRHKQSQKHLVQMASFECHPTNGVFSCEKCSYSTTLKSNYRRHVLSRAHRKESDDVDDKQSPVQLMEVMEMFIKHQETTQLQNTEMFKALADRMVTTKESSSSSTPTSIQQINTHMQANNDNKKFNLNLFLNEECKSAQNLTDFVKNVVVSMEDLEHLGQVGYTEGMAKILSKAIQEKEQTERPMHCTDVKRETIYIRENDGWKRDTLQEDTKRAIAHIAHKNYKTFMEWRQQHPEHEVADSEDYETWYRISRNMCNTDPGAVKKLVHHLATITAIEKGEMVTNRL